MDWNFLRALAGSAAGRAAASRRKGGLLVGKGGLYNNVLRMGPPLTLTEAEAREGLAILVNAIQTVAAEAL
jgi:4-aminobutyrate aminotransferase